MLIRAFPSHTKEFSPDRGAMPSMFLRIFLEVGINELGNVDPGLFSA